MVKSQVIYKDYSKDAERTALVSGENLAHMFGKIARWYTDISWVGHKHAVADITDFPVLGTAASKDVPASGDAGNNEVVMGNDSRLTDARTPTSHTHSVSEITDFPTLGTAAGYDVSSSGDASNNEVVLGNDSRLTDARTPLSHTHTEADITNLGTYAGASIKGGAATSANKLNIGNSDIGNSTTPVYFDSETGLPIALSYTIEKSVPADAVFTDTTYSTMGPSGSSHAGGLVPDTPSTAGTSKYLREDGTWEVPPNSEYVHPSHTPYSSGLYKITVDALGHVSAASAVTGADLPSHSHTVSDITNFPTLGTAAGYDVPATGDADDDEVVLGNDSRLSDARTPLSHTHTEADISDLGTYAGSSTKGGAATSANKLNIGSSDIGSETKPVYFNATTGKPVACAYSLNASVPANAVFTDINVKQSPSTANESREVLFAGNTGNTETTGTVGKSNKLSFNPNTGALTATSFSGSVDASNLTGSIDTARLPNSGVTANSYGPAAGGTLTYGGTFDVPYVTVDKYGRLTAASTKTFTMPAQYAHPTYTSKTSGLYKITVDGLGHVSATAAVTASDLPSHTHPYLPDTTKYAGSSSVGGAATSANKLNIGSSNIGNSTTPVYFDSITGLPVALSYTIEKSVPADAKFTDTVYTHPTHTAKASGLYKITVDELGHVTAASAVTGTDLPSHSHNLSMASSTGTSQISLSANAKYQLTAGGSTYIFTTPADTNTTYTVATGDSNGQIKITPSVGDAYNVSVKGLGSAAYTNSSAYATSGHTHTLNMATDTGTSQISLSANTKYKLTAGGSTYIFTTPSDTNTTYSVASGDNNGQIKITPSSGDAYNVSVKGLGSAAYTNSSAYATSGHTHTLNIAASSGTSQISLSPNTKYQLTAGGSTYIFTTPPATTMTYSISTGDNNGQIKVTPSSGDAYNVSVKGLGSAAYTNSSAYAAASHTHSSITGTQKHDAAVPTSTVGTGIFTMFYNVDNSTGNMPKVNNANAILQFNRHDGEYDSQLGFSSDGNIYYRYALGSALTTSSPWKQLAWKDDRMGANSDGSYWGMTTPNNESDAWIRTTSYGIIPYQSGGAGSGHSSLGTSAWYFDSAFIDNIYGTLHGRAVYADNSYVLVTDPSSKGTYGIVFVADPSITEDNTLRKSNSIKINHFVGAANTEGITELILGNSVAKSSAGNSSGHLTLYNSNGKWAEIYPNASATADYNLYLPASTGTLALVGDNNHTHNYAGSSSAGGAATSANKLNTNAGSNVSPVYFSGGVPVACKQAASGAYFSIVPYVRSDGVVEIGRYIDFHTTNTSTAVNYRIDQWTTESIEFNALGTNNRVNIYTPGSGYTRLSFQVGDVVTSGIIVKPLTSSGTLMQVECGGNMIIGSGESPTTLVSNSYDNIDTSETERLYLASDAEICFITSAQTYSGRKEVMLDTNGNFRIGPSQVIVQTQNSTSNYTELVNWWSGGTNPGNYGPSIGQHNVGDTDGSIIILPYHTTSNPWDAGVGLYVSKTRLLYNGTAISLNGHTHSYLPLSGGTMTGHIVFNSVTSTSYPASSNYLYWSGSTDWAKIYYRVDASDAGRLVLDIGDDTNTRIDFAYNGTTKSYIDTNGNFSGNAASATKLGTNAGDAITPVYFSGGKPVACNVQASSGSYFNNVAIIRSDGVMEMGRYIDFHNASDSTYDYTYRLESPSNGSFTLTSNTNNVLKLYSSTGYNQIRFHTGKSGKAYNASGITVYPLTTSGSCMMIESGGNMIIGAGESPSSIYSNDYLGAQTAENEYMFVSADTGVVLISGADTFANKSAAIFDYDGAFRPVTADTLSIGSSASYWNKAYITQTIGGTGGTWISARDRATVKSICVPASSAFCPVATVKTNNGAWSIGSLGSNAKNTEELYFSYTTDTNYSAGSNNHATYTISTAGAFSGSAAKWTTARTLTIGSTGKSVDGSGNVSWSLSEIGAASSSHTHKYLIDPGASAYKVEVAWEGASVPTSETTYPAVYTTYNMTSGMTIRLKETTWTNVKSFLGLGASAYKSAKTLSAVSHSGWTNNATDDNIVATMSFIAFWNGAYNSSGNSNLAYCNQGKFGSIVTKSSSYYIPLSGSTAITGELATSSANAFRAYCGGYGAFFRNDGGHVYLLFTDKKTDGSEKTASWNSLRPFYCNLSSGYVTMENGLSVKSGLTASDITTTGYLKLGYSNDSTLPSTGIYVNDIRSVNVPASGIGGHLVNFYFHMADSPDTSRWWSIMHVKGWEGAYCAWELAGTAHNTDDRTRPLYVRCSNANTAWGSWRKIYDTSNKPTLSELGAAAASHTHTYIESKANYAFTASTLPNSFDWGVSAGFVNSNAGFGSFGSVLTVRTYSGGGGTLQLYAPYSSTYGGTHLKARFGNYESSSGNSWTSLRELAWNDDKLGANSDGSYWGMSAPNNDASVWIRTTSLGIIPYQSGGLGSGHQYLGTSSWYFSQAYVDDYHGQYLGLGSSSISGKIELQGQCAESVAYGSSSPHIRFYNDNASQNIDITFCDYDTVRAPAALSVHGNQGGEYLLAPNISAWDYTNNKWMAMLSTWREGTTSTVGEGRLIAGNGTKKGTAGNAKGLVEIYSEDVGCVFLVAPATITSAQSGYAVILPSSAGTLELVGHTHPYLPIAGGTMTGNLTLTESKSILLRPNHSSYTSGIGYDTSGNECIGIWAKNTVTRLRWHAGVDMTTMSAGTMMGITYPDFEISKASGSAHGYIAGYNITRSYVLFSGSTSITAGKEKTTLTLSDQLSNYDWCVIRFWYSGSPAGYCEAVFASAHYSSWLSAAFSTTPGGGTSYTACHTMSIYIDSPSAGTRNIYFNCDAGLTIYKVIGYMAD